MKKVILILLFYTAIIFAQNTTDFDKIHLHYTPEITGSSGDTLDNSTLGIWNFGATTLSTTGDLTSDDVILGTSAPTSVLGYGAIREKVWNVQSGGTDIAANDVVVWYDTAVEVGIDTVKGVNVRISNNVLFDAYAWVKITRPATTNVDTVIVYGKDPAGTAITDTLTGPAGSVTYLYSIYLFSDVDSIAIDSDGNSGDYESDAIYFRAVKACDGAVSDLAGVATAAIGDSGGVGYIVTKGMAIATVDAATLNATPGILLTGAANGDAVTVAAATIDSSGSGKILGRTLQPSEADNRAILIEVDLN